MYGKNYLFFIVVIGRLAECMQGWRDFLFRPSVWVFTFQTAAAAAAAAEAAPVENISSDNTS